MQITNQILFFLAGLGVFNGILLSGYFLAIKKDRRWIDILFGLLMMALCIRIGKSLFHYFMDIPIIYRQLGLSACLMIGPLAYLYIHRYKHHVTQPVLHDKLHIGIPLLGITIIGIVWPYATHPDLWNYPIVSVIYGSWLIYMVYTGSMLQSEIKRLISHNATTQDFWLVIIFSSVSLLCILYIAAYFGFPYLLGPLSFSIVLYLIVGFLIFDANRSAILHRSSSKYQNNKLDKERGDELLHLLDQEMAKNKTYLNPSIKLADIAVSVDSSPHEVSQVINDRMQKTFNQYINQYRIEASCKLLTEADHLTIEGIGREVGFNSRSAFYTAFKSVKNMTPAQYKTKHTVPVAS